MAKRTQAPVPPPPSSAQRKRAAGLRSLIRDIADGVRPQDAPPKTPREITDEAAQKKFRRRRKNTKG